MTWTLVKGHKGPVKGLRALGPQGLNPLFILFYSILCSIISKDHGLDTSDLTHFPAVRNMNRQ
jgi:hypothetical protein